MQAIARARYLRISPRRVDQILMLVRRKSVAHALATLRLLAKSARLPVEKVLISAFANAGKQQNPEQWYVAQAWVGNGPMMKRMRAHAMGRGATIRHRTTHMTIVLSDEKPAAKRSAHANLRGRKAS